MEITLHPKSKVKPGDLFKVDRIYEDRLNVAKMKYEKTAILEEVLPIDSNNLVEVCKKFLEYREHNTLNFQLEKADLYFFRMKNIIEEMEKTSR